MPFKTKAKKQKASQAWAKFMESGQVTYNLPSDKKIDTEAKDLAVAGAKKVKAVQFEDSKVRAEIVKIGLLALLVIGLQIVLKVSHIGF